MKQDENHMRDKLGAPDWMNPGSDAAERARRDYLLFGAVAAWCPRALSILRATVEPGEDAHTEMLLRAFHLASIAWRNQPDHHLGVVLYARLIRLIERPMVANTAITLKPGTVASDALRLEKRAVYVAAIRSLPVPMRRIWCHKFLYGLTYKEIAAKLRAHSEHGVKMQACRANGALRAMLGDMFNDILPTLLAR